MMFHGFIFLGSISRTLLWRAGFFFCLVFFLAGTGRCETPSGKPNNPAKFKINLQNKSSASRSGLFAGKGLNQGTSSIAVNILDARFYPVRSIVLKDVKNQERIESVWDGRNAYGKEMPAGNYYASLSIVYSDGKKESKFYKFIKE